MTKPFPAPYLTTNWHTYNVALKRRQCGSLLTWFDPEMD
jgi:hypothetical protein